MNDWLSEAAGLFTSKDYIITGNNTFSFKELNERAVCLALYLQKNYGLKSGDTAAVLSENNFDFVLLIFALWKSGVVPVPINIRLNDSETNDLIKFLKPSFIFTDSRNKKTIDDWSAKIISIGSDYVIPDNTNIPSNHFISKNVPDKDFDENNTALILFTSGTSGNPKGVLLSFHNLRTSFDNSNTVLRHKPDDKWIASLPFYHIGGFSIITRTLLSGTALIIPVTLNTQDLAQTIIAYNPTFLSLVSAQLRRLIDNGTKPRTELKCVLLGGGHIDNTLLEEALKEGWPIAKVYGSTETSSLITIVNCIKDGNKKLSGGKALADNQIFIVNERNELLPTNNIGEIAVKSESCAKGYYNNPLETKIKFRDEIYFTGDSGYIDEDGYLFIDSRIDDLIISGGEKINPIEIETELLEYPGIDNVSVFGQEDIEWGQIVSAAIITKPGLSISEKELRKFLLNKISSYKVPKKYYFMKDFPISPLGKVQKEKLKELVKHY
jgi:O-succinylbenzoate-CoA ligase